MILNNSDFSYSKSIPIINYIINQLYNFGGSYMNENLSDQSLERTTLSLSLTVEDKKILKLLAAKRDTTIASIIHEWVQQNSKEVNE